MFLMFGQTGEHEALSKYKKSILKNNLINLLLEAIEMILIKI